MTDQFSRTAIQKKLEGREFSGNIKKGISNLAGQKLDNSGIKKEIIKSFSYLSKYARDEKLKKAGLNYDDRKKFEQDLFGEKKLSASELRKEAEKRKMIIRRNIAATRASSYLAGMREGEQTGQYLSGNTKSHMAMSGDQIKHGVSVGGNNMLYNRSYKNVSNKPSFGGLGTRGGVVSGVGYGGGIRPFGFK